MDGAHAQLVSAEPFALFAAVKQTRAACEWVKLNCQLTRSTVQPKQSLVGQSSVAFPSRVIERKHTKFSREVLFASLGSFGRSLNRRRLLVH